MNTIEKLHQLLDLAADIGGKQFRANIVDLVIAPRLDREIPVHLDLVYGANVPQVLTVGWLRSALTEAEKFWGRPVSAIKVSERQHRAITDLTFVPPTSPIWRVNHFDGIPLKVIAHSGGGITG